ncbi:MAG: hypothetical protein FWD57_16385, partial [Polyangiaceae bacterium]|nr:hypothetical protein [Polyangiaceae bacterium]
MLPKRITSAIKRIPYPALLRLYYAHYALFYAIPKRYAEHKGGLRRFSLSDLARKKNSDTVFILGSGSSINAISEDRWRGIRRHDSFGFNFWLLHRHVPTLYATEAPSFGPGIGREVAEALGLAASKRVQDYSDVFLLLTDLSPQRMEFLDLLPVEFTKRIHAVRTLPALARNRAELEANIRLLRDKGVFGGMRVDRFPDRLFKYRATV